MLLQTVPLTSIYLVLLAGVASLFYFLLIPAVLAGHMASRLHRLFAAYLFFSSLFSAGMFLAYTAESQTGAEIAYLVLTAPFVLSIISYYLFAKTFTQNKIGQIEGLILAVFSLILLSGVTNAYLQFFPTGSFPALLGDVQKSSLTGFYTLRVSTLTYLFVPFLLVFLILSWLTIFQNYLKTLSALESERHKYLLIGLSFIILSLIRGLIPINPIRDLPTEIPATLINVVLITYTISQYRLFNINTAFSKIVLYFNVTVLITGLYLGVAMFIQQDFVLEGLSLATVIASAAVATLFFQPLWSIAQKIANRIFLGQPYNTTEFIIQLGKSLSTLTDTEKLERQVEQAILNVLGTKKVKLYSQLPSNFKSSTPQLTFETKDPGVRKFMEKESLELLVPLPVAGKLAGALGLGPKFSKKRYTLADINLVSAAASQLAIALQNARHYEEIIKSLKLKDEFLAIASAHLRTPITAISGYLDYLIGKKGKVADEEKEIFIQHIKANNERLSALIDELLTISALEQGEVRIIPYEASLEEIVNDVISSLSYFAAENRVTVSLSLPDPPLPSLKLDLPKIREAVTNVVTNAIKFNKPNGSVRITVGRPDENHAEVKVTDTGIGIPEDELPRLFQKFHRSQKIKNPEGVGLGLYITKLIVEAHKGQIQIKSTENVGTQVSIILPITQEIPAEVVTEPEDEL